MREPTFKQLLPLVKGETVRVMPLPRDKSQTWFKTEIEELADMRSYDVKTEDGRILRRNHRHLCRRRQPFYHSQPREARVALQHPDLAASPWTSANRGSVSPNSASQPKPQLHYLARPNLYAYHLTSLSQLKIGSLELWPVSRKSR